MMDVRTHRGQRGHPEGRTRRPPPRRQPRGSIERAQAAGGGVQGNALLTNLTATVLLVLLAVEAATLVAIEGLVRVHMFVGMMLIGPVLLKLGSTGYRFVRYYAGSSPYREKGPPKPLARATAPVLVLATVSLFASGVSLMVIGHGSGGVLAVHVASFVVFAAAIAVHLVVHAPGVLRSVKPDWRTLVRRSVAGAGMRGTLLAAALGGGLALALAVLGLITGWHGD